VAQRIVVLAALRQELAPLRQRINRPGVSFVRTGVGPRRAGGATRERCGGARLLLSTGCCGGLVPGAASGMVAIPERVLELRGERAREVPAPDPELGDIARGLAEQLGLHCSGRPLCTVDEALDTPERKERCHRLSGAVAVDMETAAIARVAGELGVPYVSMRVVLDTSSETLPSLPDKLTKLRPLLELARKPGAVLTLAALALRLRSVSDNLARCAAAFLDEVAFL